MKLIKCTLLTIILLVLFIPKPGHTDSSVLNIPFYWQETQNWCWAANIQMVAEYYEMPFYQCWIAQSQYGSECCYSLEVAQAYCNYPASTNQIIYILSSLGINSTYLPGQISFPELKNQIDNGMPMIIGYSNSFNGHVVVLVGYKEDATGQWLYINDPYSGQWEVPYNASFSYNGSLMWALTLSDLSKNTNPATIPAPEPVYVEENSSGCLIDTSINSLFHD